MALNATVDIAVEIARSQGRPVRIAVLYSEQNGTQLKAKRAAGATAPLAPAGRLTDEAIDACVHIVALLGPEPYILALQAGADIILGGRTTDTAVLSAVALMRGAPSGPTWHAAKVAECGGVCSANPSSPGIMMSVDADGFTIAPLGADNRCTPYTVSAHMLYENSDPFRLVEPGGVLDVTAAEYRALDERTVRVTGSRWEPAPYTMKLEGAGGGAFQTIMLVGIEDPEVMADLDGFLERMHHHLTQRVLRTMGDDPRTFAISLRPYGWNAVSGRARPEETPPPLEIGLLFVATADTQEFATQVARICNPMFFHFPVRLGKEMPSYAFPFSPAEVERGQVFEFHLNHVVSVDDPSELVRTRWIEIDPAQAVAT